MLEFEFGRAVDAVNWMLLVVSGTLASVLMESLHRARKAQTIPGELAGEEPAQRKVRIGFSVGLGCTALFVAGAFASVRHMHEDTQQVEETHHFIASLHALVAEVIEAQNAQRGFTLTISPIYLQLFNQAVNKLGVTFGQLREQTANDPASRKTVVELGALSRRRLDLSRAVLERRRTKGIEEVRSSSEASQGPRLQEQLFSQIAALETKVNARLLVEKAHAADTAAITNTVIAGGGGMVFAFAAMLLGAISRDFAGSRRVRAALRDERARLESRVAARTAELGRINEMLREREEKISRLTSAMPGAIYTLKLGPVGRGVFSYVSPGWEELTGITVEQALGDAKIALHATHPEDVPRYQSALARAQARMEMFSIEFRIRHPRKGWIWIEARSMPVAAADGAIIWHGYAADVTARKTVELRAREQEALLREMGHLAKIGGWSFDVETGEGSWTDEVAIIHDLPPDTPITAERGIAYHVAESRPRIAAAFRAAIEQATPYDLELEIESASGRRKWIRTIGHPVMEQGRVIRVRGSFQDITERKQNEIALLEAQALYRSLVEQMPAGVFRKDAVGRFVFVNARFCRNNGFPPENFLGRTAADVLQELQRSAKADAVSASALALWSKATHHHEQIMQTGEAMHLEEDWLQPDGTHLHLLAVKTPVFDAAQRIIGTQGVQLDITPLKVAEAALRESEERFRQVVENIHEVFWMTDVERQQIIYVSPGFERIWGRPCASLLQSRDSWVASLHADDRERVLAAAAEKQMNGTYDETYRIVRPDGAVRWVRAKAFPVTDAAGHVTRIVGVAEEITEQKSLEAQFLHAQRLEAIGTLSSGIAHDLNNILAPMLMATGLLREAIAAPRDRELMELIEKSAQRGAGIIRQLLTFSRGIEGERVTVQVRHMIKEMAEIVRETFPRNLKLRELLSPDLWPILADPTQLHQVLMNLCVNARDAMPEGGVLSLAASNVDLDDDAVRLLMQGRPGRYVLVAVRDTGHGIPRELVDRIFEPFFTTKGVGKGTGLGLSTVSGIVRSHGGFVTVDSEIGLGSSFNIYLPSMPDSDAATAPAIKSTVMRGNGETILVVDDEPYIVATVSHCLVEYGYRVLTAKDGKQAMAEFLAHQPSIRVVVTDVMMPAMDGLKLARALRQLDPRVRVIASSGLDQAEKSAELTDGTIAEFLAKPYEWAELLAAVHRQVTASANASP